MVHRDVEIHWVPFYPLPSFPNFGPMVPGRIKHNLEDVVRLATTYGLPIGRPRFEDHDWPMSHAAFLWADRAGRGAAFGQALFEEHWERGESLTDERTIRRAAEKVGLDPTTAVAASADEGLRAELADFIQKNYDERDVFGVPMFCRTESAFGGTIAWSGRSDTTTFARPPEAREIVGFEIEDRIERLHAAR